MTAFGAAQAEREQFLPRAQALAWAAELGGVSLAELAGPSTRKPLVHARALFVVAVKLFGKPASNATIGAEIGQRADDTVLNLTGLGGRLLIADAEFAAAFDVLQARVEALFQEDGR